MDSKDYIPKDLASEIAKLIAAGIKQGSKQGLAESFVQDLKDQMEEYTKAQEAAKFNEKVRNTIASTGVSLRQAELEVMAAAAIRQAIANGLGEDYVTTLNKLVETRKQQLKEEVKLEEQNKKAAELAERIKKYDHERHEMLEKIHVQFSLLKDIITDQRAAMAVFTAQTIKGAESVAHAFKHIREEGFTMTDALIKTGKAATIAFNPFSPVNMEEALGSMKGLTEQLGSTAEVTADLVEDAAMLGKTFGISAEQAGKLTAQMMQLPGSSAETANNTLEYAGALAKAAKVAPGKVMNEIANNSEAFATFAKDGGKNVATAAVAASKLGMEFGGLVKMSESLLDFESSINKQMEASVLLGREINLDKAREAALNGDLVTATQEVLKNVGGEAQFNKMNVLQRKALADSLGISVQDLGKMVKNQDKLNDLTEEQREALADGSLTMDQIAAGAGGVLGKMKETGVTVVSLVTSFGGFAQGLKAAKEGATSLFSGIRDGLKGLSSLGKVKESIQETTSAGGKMAGGLGAGATLKSLAEGLKAMGDGKVFLGILATALAGPAFIAAIPSIPFLLFIGLTPLAQLGINFMNLAIGLEFMGSAKVFRGIGAMALAGPALLIAVGAIPFLAFMSIPAIGKNLESGLIGLANGLSAMGNPLVMKGALALGLVLLSAGASMLMFGAGVGIAAAGMSLLVASLKDVPFENLLALPFAFSGIAIGLTAMTIAGIGALPVIAALTGLAVAAPALTKLADVLGFGGGGGEKKEDKMDALIASVDKLSQAVLAQPVQVKINERVLVDTVRIGVPPTTR